ncbi:MAG: large conductance mechanosensitive channel protein MscL [Microbacteriaceae bacterium]|nr:large conductance mechanosensitive channel protein MscL [Microbacteriaceae bacterium]
MKGFREFILRGNVIDLAVAVVIGAAFTAIVTAIVTGIINPLIAALFNAGALDKAGIVKIGHSELLFGHVIGSVINFIIIAAIVYFVFVLPYTAFKNRMEAKRAAGAPEADVPPTTEDLLAEIRDLLAAQNKQQ